MEEFGIAHISQIAIYAEASNKSEMVSQLIFGDGYSVLEKSNNWLKIKTFDCDYEGWISAKNFNPLHKDDVESFRNAKKYFLNNYLMLVKEFETGINFPIFAGSSFPYPENELLILGNTIFSIQLPEEKPTETPTNQGLQILNFASLFLHAPYLWGGRTPCGIDCSGLVQLAYKSIGISLPRDASQQVSLGNNVDFISEIQLGDVAFFDNDEGAITHTGIICGNGTILHSSGYVRIDKIDQTGIFNKEMGTYSHKLRVIKRYIND